MESSLTKGSDELCIDVNKLFLYDLTTKSEVQVTIGLAWSIVVIAGILGNGGVVLIVGRNRRLHTARNILLLNLITADLLQCFSVGLVFPVLAFKKNWVFGEFPCRLLPLSVTICLVMSWSLVAIVLDKYVHIIRILTKPMKMRQAMAITGLIWFVSTLINVPLIMRYRVSPMDQFNVSICGVFCSEHWSPGSDKRVYGIVLLAFQFAVPLLIICFCFTRIMLKVNAEMPLVHRRSSSCLTRRQRSMIVRRQRKVNLILIMMILSFVICWLPARIINIFLDYDLNRFLPDFFRTQPVFTPLIQNLISLTSVVWNPLLFFWLTRHKMRAPSYNRGNLHNGCAK